jgi:hypothetical protein
MAASVAFLAVGGLPVAAPSRRDGGQRRIPVTAAAAVDPTDGDVARAVTVRPRSPNERLRMAVLFQAVMDLRKEPPTSRLAAETREWFASDEQGWPCAFVAICDVLGLDPDAVRARVLPASPRLDRRPWLHAALR